MWGAAAILCTSSSSVYWLISSKRTKHCLNIHKREKKGMFTENILSLPGSVANTAWVKHKSFVSKLEGIHCRNMCVCTETNTHAHIHTHAHTHTHTRVCLEHWISATQVCEVTSIYLGMCLCATLNKPYNLTPFTRRLFTVYVKQILWLLASRNEMDMFDIYLMLYVQS